MGRYNQLSRSDLTRRFHPFSSSINTANRVWNDTNDNFIPDCQLANFAPNGECEAISNANFGKFIPSATLFDDSVIKDNRDFLWDFNSEIQHEVVEGLSVAFGYNRNWDGIFQVTENTLVGPNDYDEFCITSPVDPRLPGGGGQNLCGFYDIKPQFFGQGQLRVTNSAEFGKQQRYWDGFTFNASGRLPKGIRVGGGLDIGRNVDDHCYTVDIPNQPAGLTGAQLAGGPNCRIVTAWSDQLDFRLRRQHSAEGRIQHELHLPEHTRRGDQRHPGRAPRAGPLRQPDPDPAAHGCLGDGGPLHAELRVRRSLQSARRGDQQDDRLRMGAADREPGHLQRAELEFHPECHHRLWYGVAAPELVPPGAPAAVHRDAVVLRRHR